MPSRNIIPRKRCILMDCTRGLYDPSFWRNRLTVSNWERIVKLFPKPIKEFLMQNRASWGIVSLIVLATLAVTFGPLTGPSLSQQQNSKTQDLTKYPVVDFAAPADRTDDAIEREKKKEKDKRYEKRPFVITTPQPDVTGSTIYDNEPVPTTAFPFNQSILVITGVILSSKALMSNTKSTVYSEYSVQIESILKQEGCKHPLK